MSHALERVDVAAISREHITQLIEFGDVMRQRVKQIDEGTCAQRAHVPEERAALEKIGAVVRILPFEPGYSTSGLIERMKKISSP